MALSLLRWLVQLPLSITVILVVSCGGERGSSTNTARNESPEPTVSVASTPTTSTSEEAVLRAYARYWEVYEDALYKLDTGRLNEVMTGPRLERALREVQDLRTQGRAVKLDVRSRPVVVHIAGADAQILDEYENRSYFISPTSKEPLTQPSSVHVLRDRVTLIRVGSTWKVLDLVREGEN